MLAYLLIASLMVASDVTFSASFPKHTMGVYCLIADDTFTNYTSTSNWQPELYEYQLKGFNVVWLTFINPKLMPAVPPAMINLAKCKGQPGCPASDVPVIVSIGGEAYSKTQAYWPWLQSESAAMAMAANVSQWDKLYGIDGIDLDLEGPAGNGPSIASNMVVFVKELRKLNPTFIITQPVYGEPQIKSENEVVEMSYANGNVSNYIASVGIMEYNGLYSLQFVSYWVQSPYAVPTDNLLAGAGGAYGGQVVEMANDVKSQNLGGGLWSGLRLFGMQQIIEREYHILVMMLQFIIHQLVMIGLKHYK